jgi:hypothetical protein
MLNRFLKVNRMGLLWHRPIRYIIQHSFKIVLMLYYGVVKIVDRI